MKIAVKRFEPDQVHTKEERADRRRAAYSFLLSEIRSIHNDLIIEAGDRQQTSEDPDIRPFVKDPLGKPYLPGRPEILFNLSHSRNGFAAVVVEDSSRASSAGIDIERRFPYQEMLARRICHPEEKRALQEAETEDERQALLNRIWSRKEAFLKCEGTGIRSDLRALDTIHIDKKRYKMWEAQNRDYTLAVCVRL